MIRAAVFDLDGVLVDSKEIHFNALNLALSDVDARFVISKQEQNSVFEGLTTRSKLDILTRTKGLSTSSHDRVWRNKQEYSSAMFSSVSPDSELLNLFKVVKLLGVQIGVASNSIRSTLDGCLDALGVRELVDYSLSNEDVQSPKPDPEIYVRCMQQFGTTPEETVIFEDSPIGRAAARASGAKLVEVRDRADLTFDKVLRAINGV